MEINNNNNLKKGDNNKTKIMLIKKINKDINIKSKENNINLDIEHTINIAIEEDKNKYNQTSEIDSKDNKNKNSKENNNLNSLINKVSSNDISNNMKNNKDALKNEDSKKINI